MGGLPIELDFRSEEQLMETFQCADVHLHREQHARMLAGLHHAEASLQQGDERPARRALAALADWLPLHIATQDRHLVRALRKRTDQFRQPTD
jgi:hemerythrin-like metal-binding protein